MITERGKPIARIIGADNGKPDTRKALAPLMAKGFAVMPSKSLKKDALECFNVGGKPASEIVIEDRS